MIKRLLKELLRYLAIAIMTTIVVLLVKDIGDFVVNKQLRNQGSYPVLSVYDGDTIGVKMDGREQKVRLIGVDTPETGGNDTNIECYGFEATDYVRDLLDGERVVLKADPLSTNRDRYERLLRFVERKSDGLDVNLELVKNGYSPFYNNFPHSRLDEFRTAAEQAQERQIGLHAECVNETS
ncbi:MAG: thermonuclease family protein [Patescibacteria group bacterium]